VNVQIAFANEVETHAETFGASTNASERGLCRLLHHVAEFAGERHASATFNQRRFDLQHLAADLRPGKSGSQTDLALCGDALLAELDRAEHLTHARRIDGVCRRFA
jgi:hypothetical protein